MLIYKNQILDISELEAFSIKFCKKLKLGNVIMLKGELGSGKTTLSRFIIKNLYKLNRQEYPETIISPTYPILVTYNLVSYEIFHYDFYRIKDTKELLELDFIENIDKNITIIEWPELLIDMPFNKNYYLISLELNSNSTRIINVKYSN